MAGLIAPDDKPDINALLEHYGVRTQDRTSYMTHCPLHEDATPSCSVRTDQQFWNCKSCGRSGDSINLIEIKENCNFRRALEFAASLGLSAGGPGGGSEPVSGGRFTGRRRVAPKGNRKGGSGYTPSWRRS